MPCLDEASKSQVNRLRQASHLSNPHQTPSSPLAGGGARVAYLSLNQRSTKRHLGYNSRLPSKEGGRPTFLGPFNAGRKLMLTVGREVHLDRALYLGEETPSRLILAQNTGPKGFPKSNFTCF